MKKYSTKIILILSLVCIICISISAITLDEAERNQKLYWKKENKERMERWIKEYQAEKTNE